MCYHGTKSLSYQLVTLVCVQGLSQILLEVGRVLGSITYRGFLSIAFLPVFVYCVFVYLLITGRRSCIGLNNLFAFFVNCLLACIYAQ